LFGANDACLQGAAGSQHVPLSQYKKNIIDIIDHPAVKRQKPRIILVTPPPINEYMCEENDRAKGYFEPRRSAEHTKLYVDVVREIAQTHGIALLDLWLCFMKHAGWKEGDAALAGSKKMEPNAFLRMLLHDGTCITSHLYWLQDSPCVSGFADTKPRPAFHKRSLYVVLPRNYAHDRKGLAGSDAREVAVRLSYVE